MTLYGSHFLRAISTFLVIATINQLAAIKIHSSNNNISLFQQHVLLIFLLLFFIFLFFFGWNIYQQIVLCKMLKLAHFAASWIIQLKTWCSKISLTRRQHLLWHSALMLQHPPPPHPHICMYLSTFAILHQAPLYIHMYISLM